MNQFPDEFEEYGELVDSVNVLDGGLAEFRVPSLGLSVFYENDDRILGPSIHSLLKHTPELRIHGRSGFSLQHYHEFFVKTSLYEPRSIQFRLGDALVQVGRASPLAMHIFDQVHDRDWHAEWEDIEAVRFIGPSGSDAELYLLNAIIHLGQSSGISVKIRSLSDPNWTTPDDESGLVVRQQRKIERNIEPLRLFYFGVHDPDNMSACVHYYRVIEFYAFLEKHIELDRLRLDRSLSSKEFLFKAAKQFGRGEQEDICAFIGKAVKPNVLLAAMKSKLINNQNAAEYANELYKLRNSLVHSKYSNASAMIVESTTEPSESLAAWRASLQMFCGELVERFSATS